MNHSDMERELIERAKELMQSLMQGWMDQKAPGRANEPVVDAQGRERTRERRGQTRQLMTIFGPVVVERTGYGADGEASLHPLDAQLNLPEDGYSLELRRRVAIEASKSSFDEVVKTIAETTGATVPKRQAEELTQRAAQDFDAFYAARQAAAEVDPEPTHDLVVITADGKGVAMRREDLRPETRAAAAADGPAQTLRRQVTRAEAKHGKRMAAVASVYAVEPHIRTPDQVVRELARTPPEANAVEPPPRPRPQNKRVWASLEKAPRDVIEDAFAEASSRDLSRTKTWVAVVDGNEHQLDLLEAASRRHAAPITIVLDLFHVLMYVWHAGRALEGDDDTRIERWVLERMRRLLEGDAVMVAAGMRRSATRRELDGARRKAVDDCANYLLKYRDYLRYHEYLAAGLPIASGVIEGACRHLVQDRMGITGARWRLTGAEAVLRIRALRSSGDFDEYWKFHEACELERNHVGQYFRGKLPELENAAALRLVPPRA